MRGSNDDTDLWGGLRSRGRRAGAPPRQPWSGSLPPEARGRLIDAALAVLGSVRTVVDVAEEVLEDRRSRLAEGGDREPWVRAPEDPPRRRPTESRDEGVVRDIPFSGT